MHRLGTPADIRASRDFTYDLWHTTSPVVDVFTRDNAITIAVSLLLDAPRDLS